MKKITFLLSVCTLVWNTSWSQTETVAVEAAQPNWKKGASLGMDIGQLLLINPKAGAGENRIGFGTISGTFANYAKDKWTWDNDGSWQFGIQKLGSSKNSFTKNVDDLRLNSKAGYAITPDKKWFAATEVGFRSQITSTYGVNQLKASGQRFQPEIPSIGGNPAIPAQVVDEKFNLLSEFLSPATLTIAPGIDYKPNEKLSFLLSPASAKFLIVGNDNLASLGVHGNPWNSPTDFENVFSQLGASLVGKYNTKYFNDKLVYNTRAGIFSNYLNKPENLDVEWVNELGYEIFKGLSLSMAANLFYDHDIDHCTR